MRSFGDHHNVGMPKRCRTEQTEKQKSSFVRPRNILVLISLQFIVSPHMLLHAKHAVTWVATELNKPGTKQEINLAKLIPSDSGSTPLSRKCASVIISRAYSREKKNVSLEHVPVG